MKDLTTQVPASLVHEEGEFWIVVPFELNGESYCVRSPIGDGRYLAERVVELIIAPAISPRPLDYASPND